MVKVTTRPRLPSYLGFSKVRIWKVKTKDAASVASSPLPSFSLSGVMPERIVPPMITSAVARTILRVGKDRDLRQAISGRITQ